MITVKQNGDVLEVRGCSAKWLQSAIEHKEYLVEYRKGYSKTKKAKADAVKQAAMDRGLNVKEIEAKAVLELKKSQR